MADDWCYYLYECSSSECDSKWSKTSHYDGKCDKCFKYFCKDHIQIIPIEDQDEYFQSMRYCSECIDIINDETMSSID